MKTEHSASGAAVPVVQSEVAARVSGVVKKVYQLAGEWVKQDQVIVQLDDSQLRLRSKPGSSESSVAGRRG